MSICELCRHKQHQPGACGYVTFYGRGPNSPPGNSRCTCGGIIPLSVPKFEDDLQRQKASCFDAAAELSDWLREIGSADMDIVRFNRLANNLHKAIDAARESEGKK